MNKYLIGLVGILALIALISSISTVTATEWTSGIISSVDLVNWTISIVDLEDNHLTFKITSDTMINGEVAAIAIYDIKPFSGVTIEYKPYSMEAVNIWTS